MFEKIRKIQNFQEVENFDRINIIEKIKKSEKIQIYENKSFWENKRTQKVNIFERNLIKEKSKHLYKIKYSKKI